MINEGEFILMKINTQYLNENFSVKKMMYD